MKKWIISLIALVLLTQSCTSDKKKALEFNNKVAKLSTNYMSKAQELGSKIGTALSTRDFSNLQKPYDELIKIIEDDIEQIKKLENVKGSAEMKNAVLDYMKFEREVIEKTFGPFTKMTKSTTDEEIKKARDNMMSMIAKEKEYLAKVRKIQQEYAQKNGFGVAPQ